MRRILLLMLFVCVASSVAKSQDKPRDKNSPRDQQNVARPGEERRGEEIYRHTEWPAQPKISPPAKQYYTRMEAKFAVTNDTAKKVKQITWECTLLHPDTNDEIGKYTLVRKKKIAPHQGAVLKEKVVVPLRAFSGPKVVPVNQTQTKPGVPDVAQAVQVNKIIEILYADGSVSRP